MIPETRSASWTSFFDPRVVYPVHSSAAIGPRVRRYLEDLKMPAVLASETASVFVAAEKRFGTGAVTQLRVDDHVMWLVVNSRLMVWRRSSRNKGVFEFSPPGAGECMRSARMVLDQRVLGNLRM